MVHKSKEPINKTERTFSPKPPDKTFRDELYRDDIFMDELFRDKLFRDELFTDELFSKEMSRSLIVCRCTEPFC